MSPSITCFIITVAVLATGVIQGETLPSGAITGVGDAIYNQFASMIEFEEQLAQAKLNFVVSYLASQLAASPIDPIIQTNLSQCFKTAVANTTGADPDCLQDVSTSVNQTIYDSQQQLGFCANLTHGWLVTKGQLPGAYAANASLETVAEEILAEALLCAKRFTKNPSKEFNCMLKVQQEYSTAWQNATNNITQAYDEMSGLSLLLGLNIQDCVSLEEYTLKPKCDEITADVVDCTQNAKMH